MNYSEIKNCDIANGPGVRVTLLSAGVRIIVWGVLMR